MLRMVKYGSIKGEKYLKKKQVLLFSITQMIVCMAPRTFQITTTSFSVDSTQKVDYIYCISLNSKFCHLYYVVLVVVVV